MKCQICNENNANIIFTKIVNNEKVSLNICTECAKKKGLTVKISTSQNLDTEHESPSLDFFGKEDMYEKYGACESCGLTYAEFRKTGLFGCDRCHESFGMEIVTLLKKIHGSTVHDGKTPLNISGEFEMKKHLRTLRSRLQRCIESEEYELAADLRDKIAVLEEKVTKDES
jgi:protein arginine kinase activator